MLLLFLYAAPLVMAPPSFASREAAKKVNILVHPFTNTGTAQYSWISAGMTQSVISDLSKISSISVFSEEDRKKAIREIELGMTGLIKESDVAKVGQIMGAELLCSGNYTVSGGRIRINARIVSVEKAIVHKAVTLDGSIDQIFELQDRIVTDLMATANESSPPDARRPVFTDQDRANIKKLPRPGLRAFELYAKGLELYDTDPAGALRFFTQALSVEREYYHALIASGGACSILGNPDEAERYYRLASGVLDKAGLGRSAEAASLNYHIGINFWSRGDSRRAVRYSVEAYKILESLGEQRSRLAAAVLMLCGGGYRYMDRLADALQCTERSIALYENLGLQGTSDYAWGLNNLAVVYSMMGDRSRPIALYKRCLKIWSSLGLSVSMGTAYTYCQTGYEYYAAKDYEKAYDNLLKGRDLCIQLKLNNSFNFAYYTWYLAGVFSDGFGDHCIAADLLKNTVDILNRLQNPAVAEAKNALQGYKKKCADGRVMREKEEQLVSAAMRADTTTVKKLLSGKVNINARVFMNGASPLYGAAYKGHLDTVKLLVENGADMDVRMYRGFTPLMGALINGQYNVVKYLVSKNASVNAADCRGETPLMYAASTPSGKEIVELLISKGADVNARNDEGESVLQKSDSLVAPLLRRHGAK